MILPTAQNCAVLFLDLQAEIVPNSSTVAPDKLAKSAGALARIATLHRVPSFVSIVGQGGAFMPEVTNALDVPELRPRTQTSAFSDTGLVDALAASGRKLLILSGVASEIVVQRTAIDALAAGYAVGVAVDACGGISARTEDAAWRRITAAGGFTTSVTTFIAELAGDFTTEIGGQSIGIMYDSFA